MLSTKINQHSWHTRRPCQSRERPCTRSPVLLETATRLAYPKALPAWRERPCTPSLCCSKMSCGNLADKRLMIIYYNVKLKLIKISFDKLIICLCAYLLLPANSELCCKNVSRLSTLGTATLQAKPYLNLYLFINTK